MRGSAPRSPRAPHGVGPSGSPPRNPIEAPRCNCPQRPDTPVSAAYSRSLPPPSPSWSPTACDYGVTGGLHGTGSSSDMPGMDHGSDDQQPVVVPVANLVGEHHVHERRGRGPAAAPQPRQPDDDRHDSDLDGTSSFVQRSRRDRQRHGHQPGRGRGRARGTRGPGPDAAGRRAGRPTTGWTSSVATATRFRRARPTRRKSQKDLQLHNGFQSVGADGKNATQGNGVATCVNTEMGAVASEDK